MYFKTLIAFACLSLCQGLQLTGKLTGVPDTFELHSPSIINGRNLAGRCSAQLTSLATKASITAPVTSKYEFKFFDVEEGKYDLLVSCHDFLFHKDRFNIDVNSTTILATHYYLNKEEVDQPVDITDTSLVFVFGNIKEYYEIRSGSIKDMAMNSPIGFIFKNTTYTIMFVFCIIMMVGPYLLKIVNPDFAKRLEEIQREGMQGGREKVEEAKEKKTKEIRKRR